MKKPFVQPRILLGNERESILFQNLHDPYRNNVRFIRPVGGDIAPFFGLVIIRDALLSCGKVKFPLDVLFRCVQQVRGRLQLIDVLKTDGNLPMLRPLFPGGFALDDVFVKNVLGIRFHSAAACKFILSL